MSHETEHQAMKDGEALGKMLTELIRFNVDQHDGSDAILWWAGFLGHIAGCCGGSIGHEAAGVIGETLQRVTAQIAREKAN